jgi:DNA-binding transcriptional LysR family regulator
VRGGDLDLALIQVIEPAPRDRVLWTESIEWIASPTYVIDLSESLPLVTFGPNSNYRALMLGALRAANIDHYIAFESESSAGVRSAVAAGFGVALINGRGVTEECPIWEFAEVDAVMPIASFIVRVNSRSRTSAVRTLIDEIQNTLA